MDLLVPRIVLREFRKSRERVAVRAQRSLAAHFNLAKDVIRNVEGDGKDKATVLAYLSDMDHCIPLSGGAAAGRTLDRIESLLTHSTLIEASDEVKLRAVDRAVNRK